jgi:hypothetical protein
MVTATKTRKAYTRTAASGSGGKHTYAPPRWKFDEILFGLGPDTDLADKIVARGYPRIPRSSLAGWRMRNSIPPFWVPLIIQMALEAKLIKSIESLRVK